MFLCDINRNNSKSFFHILCKFDILWKFRDSTPPKFFQKWLVFRASNIKFTVFIRVRRDLFVSAKRRIHSAQINEPFKLIKDVRRKVTLTWCVFFRMSLLSAFIETGVRQHFLKISCIRDFFAFPATDELENELLTVADDENKGISVKCKWKKFELIIFAQNEEKLRSYLRSLHF